MRQDPPIVYRFPGTEESWEWIKSRTAGPIHKKNGDPDGEDEDESGQHPWDGWD